MLEGDTCVTYRLVADLLTLHSNEMRLKVLFRIMIPVTIVNRPINEVTYINANLAH